MLGVRLHEAYCIDADVTDPELAEHGNRPAADAAVAPES
ncbi:Uncharacterised protein [Mycobacteroides abscessus subsp. massiliense]|nr:hypothetical protein [Mycobacteroides abscessus]SLH51971.1 Uncharacterised protein [Mycobacteroides abscessus subsp. massiliense]